MLPRSKVEQMTIRTVKAAALFLSWTTAISDGFPEGSTISAPGPQYSERSLLTAAHSISTRAIVAPIAIDSAPSLHELAVSAFFVDYPPGTSVMLHRLSAPGCVLVHVLSGTIRALAWHAGMGIYRADQTWVAPVSANSIEVENASDWQSAGTLVVLGDARCSGHPDPEDPGAPM